MLRGSQRYITYYTETSPGVIPTSPTTKYLKIKPDASLGWSADPMASAIVSADRQRALPRGGKIATDMSYPFELGFGDQDDFILAAMEGSSWASAITMTVSTISASSADNSINDSGSGFVAAGFAAGDIIRVAGFSNSANNGFFRAVSVVAGKIVVAGRYDLVTESAGASITVDRPVSTHTGTTLTTFGIQQAHSDLATGSNGMLLTGCVVNDWNLTVNTDSLVSGTFGLIGRAAKITETVTADTLSVSDVDDSINDSANGLGNFVAGDIIHTSGFSTGANNGDFTVVSATSAKIVTDGTLTTESAGATATVTTEAPEPASAASVVEIFGGLDTGTLVSSDGLSSTVTNFDFTLSNAVAAYHGVGNRYPVAVLDGMVDISGTLSVFIDDMALAKRVIAETAGYLSLVLVDLDGNSYTIIFPSIRFSSAPMDAGEDGPIISGLPWIAGKSEAYQTSMIVIKDAA